MPVLLACVIVPYLFWSGTWFGKALDTEQIIARLDAIQPSRTTGSADREKAKLRQAQHAFEQISRRIVAAAKQRASDATQDQELERIYDHVLPLAEHPAVLVRESVAWVMGEDEREARFTEPLRKLVADPNPGVRRNAALALARRMDQRALPVLRQMLRPFAVRAEVSGEVLAVIEGGRRLDLGNEIARIRTKDGGVRVQRAPLKGQIVAVSITKGARIEQGALLCKVKPTSVEVFYALHGIAALGDASDLPLVEPWTSNRPAGRRVRGAAIKAKASLERRISAGK